MTHGDLADGQPCEMLLASIGLERDLMDREVCQPTGGLGPRLVLDLNPIVEVDPQPKIFEQTGLNAGRRWRSRRAVLWCAIDRPRLRDEGSDRQSDACTDRGGTERANNGAV